MPGQDLGAFALSAGRARLSRVSGDVVDLEFSGEAWEWRGPAPFHFVSVPDDLCDEVRELGEVVSYGWGMVPVTLRIGGTTATTVAVAQGRRLRRPAQGRRAA